MSPTSPGSGQPPWYAPHPTSTPSATTAEAAVNVNSSAPRSGGLVAARQAASATMATKAGNAIGTTADSRASTPIMEPKTAAAGRAANGNPAGAGFSARGTTTQRGTGWAT